MDSKSLLVKIEMKNELQEEIKTEIQKQFNDLLKLAQKANINIYLNEEQNEIIVSVEDYENILFITCEEVEN